MKNSSHYRVDLLLENCEEIIERMEDHFVTRKSIYQRYGKSIYSMRYHNEAHDNAHLKIDELINEIAFYSRKTQGYSRVIENSTRYKKITTFQQKLSDYKSKITYTIA